MVPIRAALKAFEPSLNIYRKMDGIAREVPFGVTRRCRDTCWNWSPNNYFLTADFDNLTSLKFCGRDFSAVPHWHETLASMFGDYMQLPPENQRVSHGLRAWYYGGE